MAVDQREVGTKAKGHRGSVDTGDARADDHDAAGSDADTRLLLSSRGWDDVIYRDELERLGGDGLRVVHTLTRSQPPGWAGYARRVDAEMLAEVGPGPAELPQAYVCGPTPFVEAVAEALVQLGHQPHRVKTERFGPTGG